MKPIWTILITVVATAAIVGSGTWYLANKSMDKDKSDLQAQIDDLSAKISGTTVTSGVAVTSGATVTSGSTTTGTTVADPTAGWKTYTNTTYGFSIKYPTAWVEVGSEKNANGNLLSWSVDDGDMFNGVSVNVLSKSLQTKIAEAKAGNASATETKSTINGLSWTIISSPANDAEHTPGSTSYLIEKNSKTYQVIGETVPHLSDLQKMMTTFHFTK